MSMMSSLSSVNSLMRSMMLPEGIDAPKLATSAEDQQISKFIEDYKKNNPKVGGRYRIRIHLQSRRIHTPLCREVLDVLSNQFINAIFHDGERILISSASK